MSNPQTHATVVDLTTSAADTHVVDGYGAMVANRAGSGAAVAISAAPDFDVEPVSPGVTAGSGRGRAATAQRLVRVRSPLPVLALLAETAALVLTAGIIGNIVREVGPDRTLPGLALLGLVAASGWWIEPWSRVGRRRVFRPQLALLALTVGVGFLYWAVAKNVIPGATRQMTTLMLGIVALRAASVLATRVLTQFRRLGGHLLTPPLLVGRLLAPVLSLAGVSGVRQLRELTVERDYLLGIVAGAELLSAIVMFVWLVVETRLRRGSVVVATLVETQQPDGSGELAHRPPFWATPGSSQGRFSAPAYYRSPSELPKAAQTRR